MAKDTGTIVVHFGEIWLKGRNRNLFVGQLLSNVQRALEGRHCKVQNMGDRFIVELQKGAREADVMAALEKIPGVSWFAPVMETDNEIKSIVKMALTLMDKKTETRVVTNRAYKKLPFTSVDVTRAVVEAAMKKKLPIDKDSDNVLHVNITRKGAMIYNRKIRGVGGLPVGSSGRAVVLLSGGIDSPVAATYAMKRGLRPIYLHIHAFPNNKSAESSKIKKLLSTLEPYSGESKCYFVPGHLFQAAVLGKAERFELVLFKRFAYKLAEEVAKREKAKVIVTGESLGQVASQTVGNLIATEGGSHLFYMRPLIGFDKQEIINEAKRIGTYDISVQEYPDVCSINARNPATSARRHVIDALYEKCGLDEVVQKTLEKGSLKK